jgi:hypothetical protein
MFLAAPYHYGLYNNDIFLSTDFSKPAHTNVSGQWVPVPMSAEVKVSNDGHCVLSSYNATVHYKSWTGRAPRVVVSQDPMHFQIPDLLVVANITFSFGGVFHSGSKSAFLMQYEDASKGMSCWRLRVTICSPMLRAVDHGAHADLRRFLRRRRLDYRDDLCTRSMLFGQFPAMIMLPCGQMSPIVPETLLCLEEPSLRDRVREARRRCRCCQTRRASRRSALQ